VAKRGRRAAVHRSKHRQYQRVADHFFVAARDSLDLGYWTAAGVLMVHSAIAYAHALCIQKAGEKSSGDNHEDAVTLLDEVIAGESEKANAIAQLRRIIEEKTKVSYLGNLYSAKQCEELWRKLSGFRKWAEDILNR
jgi:hypothetical protein